MVSQDRRVSVKEKSTLTWLRKVTKKYRSFVVLLVIFEIIVSGLGVCYALVIPCCSKGQPWFCDGNDRVWTSCFKPTCDPHHNETGFGIYQKQHGKYLEAGDVLFPADKGLWKR